MRPDPRDRVEVYDPHDDEWVDGIVVALFDTEFVADDGRGGMLTVKYADVGKLWKYIGPPLWEPSEHGFDNERLDQMSRNRDCAVALGQK